MWGKLWAALVVVATWLNAAMMTKGWISVKTAAIAVSKWTGYWKEIPWTLLALGGLVVAYYLLPRLDPSSGIDGFGDLFAVGLAVVKGMVIAFSAWWCNKHYIGELSDSDDMLLRDRASKTGEGAWVLIIDRLSFFAWLGFWYFVVSH